jgi:hypothetical protein
MRKKLHCACLFADGHAVMVYERRDPQAGDIRWAEIVEKFGPECRFTGRVMFHDGSGAMLNLCRKAVAVRVTHATLEVEMANTHFNKVWPHDLSSVLGAPHTHQPEQEEKFDPEISRWADYRVTKVHRCPPSDIPPGASRNREPRKP